MSPFYRIYIYLLLNLMFTMNAQAEDSVVQSSKSITLVEINDLHAYLVPHKDLVVARHETGPNASTEIVERGGVARIATLLELIRSVFGNTLVMNVGDTFYGGVEATYTLGNAIVPAVNALDIDVGVPGNWDFAYGPYVTRARYAPQGMPFLKPLRSVLPKVDAVNFPNLAANVVDKNPLSKSGSTFLPATLMKTVDEVKVGFIGITSDIVPRMHSMLALGLEFLQGEEKYKALINQHAKSLRDQGAHVVVVMSELGLHKNYRLAQIIDPGVDVIFSAHTHEATYEPLASASGAVVVEAGNDGYLGWMRLSLIDNKIDRIDWHLIPIDDTIEEHTGVKQLVDLARAPFFDPDIDMTPSILFANQKLTQPIDTVVGTTELMLTRRGALENSFNNTYTDWLRASTQTDLAIVPGFRFGATIAQSGYIYEDNAVIADGAITLEDVYRFFPMSFPVSTALITGTNLKQLLEESLTQTFSSDTFKHSGGWFSGISGLEIQLDLSRPDGQRVLAIRDSDTRALIGPDEQLRVVSCTRPFERADRLCGSSGFTGRTPARHPVTGARVTAIDSLLELLANGPVRGKLRTGIQDDSGIPAWPSARFIQTFIPTSN